MSSEPLPDNYVHQLEDKYTERRSDEFKSESSTVIRYIEAVSKRLAGTYTINEVLAVGGTGIVHTGQHIRFHQPVVLKINRPHIRSAEVSRVANEAQLLPTLSHPNIIPVLDLATLCDHKSGFCDCDQHPEACDHPKEDCAETPKLTYIVEPFITGSKPFFAFDQDRVVGTWLHEKLEQLKEKVPNVLGLRRGDDSGKSIQLITALLRDVAALFSQWVDLLLHIHNRGYVYLDVKPENVLIDQHGHLTSIDYGSVEYLDTQDQTPIDVFFTERYAHTELIKRKLEKASSNRVRGGIKRSELRCAFDYFALGISMLEILNQIADIREHLVPQLPLYRSLHFLATRLLDGQNSSRPTHDYPHAKQVFPNLGESDYENLGYSNLDDVYRDLEKERGRWNLEDKVPELATYSKDIVRVVPGFNTVLTARLRGVIEHPLVARLKYVTQLGLVSLVYPTADHSRYDHALGSYTYTTYYVKSLFNDLGNPLFRNLVGTQDLNAVLLAALLHDLGQYPLAHDLEEVHDGIFKHGRIGTEFLEDPMRDQHGRTLLDIIQDPKHGWGVSAATLRRIFETHSKNLALAEEEQNEQKISLKINVLTAIVDGQVDADKADYIIRDSARCELPYGSQLDIERLLRVLTVAVIPSEMAPERRVTLGVYDKGLVSAHAFGQARYELLSTVYWHHTARIIKAMLQYATALGLPVDVFNPDPPKRESKEIEIRQRLLKFLKSLVPPFDLPSETPLSQKEAALDLAAEPRKEVIATLSNDASLKTDDSDLPNENGWYPGIAWTDWLMLRWIADLPNAASQSRHLIHDLQARRLYKRVAAFARGGPQADVIEKLDNLQWPARVHLCKQLHDKVYEQIRRSWGSLDTATTMSKTDFERLCESHLLILIDIPSPSKKIGYARPLGVVPELKEKSYNQGTRQAFEDTPWRDIMNHMIDGIAPVRVLCHPDVRNLVSSIYAPSKPTDNPLETKIAEEINGFLSGS